MTHLDSRKINPSHSPSFPPPLSLFSLAEFGNVSPVEMSPSVLSHLIAAWIDVLISQQLPVTLWVKFPTHQSWLPEIQRYLKQVDLSSPIYLCCGDEVIANTNTFKNPHSRFIPISFKAETGLKQESFIVARSPQWSSLIVAQSMQPSSPASPFQVFCNFDPSQVQMALSVIYEAVAESNLPEIPAETPSPPSEASNTEFLTHLLLQHLHRLQNPVFESPSSTLPEEFLQRTIGEFSTPLTNMKTAISLLESKTIRGSQRQRYFEMLHRECDRQNSLISRLHELLQIDSDHANEITSSERLCDLIPSIVSTYQPLANEKGISLGYTVSPGLPPVSCPANWIKQMILHLLNNSLNFTLSGGQVTVLASHQGKKVLIQIKDTGVGILPQDLPKVFDSFYRKSSHSETRSGAGLGLAIVEKLAESCGGSISAVSQSQKGSVFTLILPIADAVST